MTTHTHTETEGIGPTHARALKGFAQREGGEKKQRTTQEPQRGRAGGSFYDHAGGMALAQVGVRLLSDGGVLPLLRNITAPNVFANLPKQLVPGSLRGASLRGFHVPVVSRRFYAP